MWNLVAVVQKYPFYGVKNPDTVSTNFTLSILECLDSFVFLKFPYIFQDKHLQKSSPYKNESTLSYKIYQTLQKYQLRPS